MEKLFTNTTLLVAGGTIVSLICLLAIWYFSILALGYGGANIDDRTQFIVLAIPVFLILIFDVLIVAKIINISPALIIIGHFVLTVGVWIIICIGMIVWYGTSPERMSALHKKITQKGELLFDYYDADNNNRYEAYYSLNKKVYHVIKGSSKERYFVSACEKAKNIDTSYYAKLSENDKFTILYKKEHSRNYDDVDYHYPPYLMHLHGVGFFKMYHISGSVDTVSELNAEKSLEDMIVMTIKT